MLGLAAAWKALHLRKPFLGTSRVVEFQAPCFTRLCGRCDLGAAGAGHGHTSGHNRCGAQLKLSSRALRLHGDWPMRHGRISCRGPLADGGRGVGVRIGRGGCDCWWRYEGHVARLAVADPARLFARVLPRRGARWRETVRTVSAIASDPARCRLGRPARGMSLRPMGRNHPACL